MDKSQLRRLMPIDKNDIEAAREIVALGYPTVEPILPEMLLWVRVYQSEVADVFCEFFANLGSPAVNYVSSVLMWKNIPALRFRIVTEILPRWPRELIEQTVPSLNTLLTASDAYNTDLYCIKLLQKYNLADSKWLKDWLNFKMERLDERLLLARTIEQLFEITQQD